MKAALSGASGLIGTRLIEHLLEASYEIVNLSRTDFSLSDKELSNKLIDCRIIINLAGAPIIARHTSAYKIELYNSRINTTKKLVKAIKLMDIPPAQFFSASAMGIYNHNDVHTENSTDFANDFLGRLCQDWESEAMKAMPACHVVITRFGIVLDSDKGALPTMLLPFKLGLGGKIGNGRQMFSWIHIYDLVKVFSYLITNQKEGVYNVVSPGYLPNSQLTKAISSILNKPSFFTVPEFVLRIIYGDGAKSLTSGQTAYPERLLNEGFQFRYTTFEEALFDLTQQ